MGGAVGLRGEGVGFSSLLMWFLIILPAGGGCWWREVVRVEENTQRPAGGGTVNHPHLHKRSHQFRISPSRKRYGEKSG